MIIREATEEEAHEGIETLRRSIAELCSPDHHGNAERIASWLQNKTPETWSTWINSPKATLYVSVSAGEIAGVSMMSASGDILLNYISPDMRFCGVSKAMMQTMESAALDQGLNKCRLSSTKTAAQFYRSIGYELVKADQDGLSMQKKLSKEPR